MSLPIRTTVQDIEKICRYLNSKPTGATLAEIKAVVEKKHVDHRKFAALRFWGLIDEEGERFKLTERGRRTVKNAGVGRSDVLKDVVRRTEPYKAIVERALNRGEETMTATEVASHWHEHFTSDVSTNDKILNEQAVCFFHAAQGADLGELVLGRRGRQTRFDFALDEVQSFEAGGSNTIAQHDSEFTMDKAITNRESDTLEHSTTTESVADNNRVFITHGRNKTILEQVKELVSYGKFEPVVAIEHETSAKPVPKKVMDDMRSCRAAVIHVGADRILYDDEGNEFEIINENVLIEIGAAMALYENKFTLLVEEGLDLPTNLQGLYTCRYKGTELNMSATMKLLKAISKF